MRWVGACYVQAGKRGPRGWNMIVKEKGRMTSGKRPNHVGHCRFREGFEILSAVGSLWRVMSREVIGFDSCF